MGGSSCEAGSIPSDLPEAEAELVAGFNVDYSSVLFALFFLGEYCSMILQATLMVLLFLGGWRLNILPTTWTTTLPCEASTNMNNWTITVNSEINDLSFLLQKYDVLYTIFFAIKVAIVCFFFVFVRALYPRFRYDQLMDLGWKSLLPLTIGFLMLTTYMTIVIKSGEYSEINTLYLNKSSWQHIKPKESYTETNSIKDLAYWFTCKPSSFVTQPVFSFNNWPGNFDSYSSPTTLLTQINDLSYKFLTTTPDNLLAQNLEKVQNNSSCYPIFDLIRETFRMYNPRLY